ncbi:MAG: hypothetical protein ACYTG0_02585 [Planctomycetota bacterium]|jgi:hypothetical protein
MRSIAWVSSALGCLAIVAASATAQQVTISTPHNNVSESFFENIGSSWSLRGKNWFFNFGGSPFQAAPQFGGFDPSAGVNFGAGVNGRSPQGNFNFNWSQGFRRGMVSQTPMVTLTPGVPGYFSDTSQSPFVIGHVPVVGGFPTLMHYWPVPPPTMTRSPGVVASALQKTRAEAYQRRQNRPIEAAPRGRDAAGQPNLPPRQVIRPQADNDRRPQPAGDNQNARPPAAADDLILVGSAPGAPAARPADEPARMLAAARTSSAGRPVPSVTEARRLHAAERTTGHDQALGWLERGRHAEAMGKPNVAKVYYQMAARRATDPLRQEILSKIAALESGSESR